MQKIVKISEPKKSAREFQNKSFLHPGGHQNRQKRKKNAIPELPQTPSGNSGEICRFFGALKPRKRCWRLHGSFILTFATNLELAPKRLPKNLLLGTLSAPKWLKFGIRCHLKNYSKIKRPKVTKSSKKCPQMGYASRAEIVFLDASFEILPQTGAKRRREPKIIVFPFKSAPKDAQKLTHLSSLCSLRNICGELGDTKMAPSFAPRVLSFSLQHHGESHVPALAHIFRGAPMSRR